MKRQPSQDVGIQIVAAIGAILARDLDVLTREVNAFPQEPELWQVVPGVSNSAGTLALHLAGNLQHFIGAVLGNTGYVRDRPAEFSRRNVSRAELLGEIEAARAAIRSAVSSLSPERLASEYPETIAGVRLKTGEYLLHLLTHTAYHLGQIDYLRRVITGSNQALDAMRPADLSSARPAAVQA